MKKKLTINTLAVGNLKKRKKQYAIMVVGIVLAMVFSSSILFFMFSAGETYKEKSFKEIGYQNSIIYADGFSEADYKNCVSDGLISDYGFAHTVGYAYTVDDEQHLGASVTWLDDKAKALSYQIFLEGSYPQKENEIAIEQGALIKLGYNDAELGDLIKLKLRVQNGSDYLNTAEKEYKLVGIVSDKKKNIENLYSTGEGDTLVPAIFVAQNTQTEPGGREKLVAYATIDEKNDYYKNLIKSKAAQGEYYDASSVICSYLSEKTDVYDINCSAASERLNLTGFSSISSNSEYIVIIAFVLVFASCVAIINAFNTNLKERRNQIGMLRAVGATRRQIINIFGREAFIISLTATPVSIVLSYFIVRVLLRILSDEAVMAKSVIILPIAAAVNICVVMLAALVPLAAASRITPMQAIRNINNNRRVKTKKIKSKTEFNASSHIAKRNLTFYKGGRAAVSIMLVATIAFSCLGFSFMAYSKENYYTLENDYMLEYLSSFYSGAYINYENEIGGMTEYERQDIASMPYVSDTYGSKTVTAAVLIDGYNGYFKTLTGDALMFGSGYENINSVEDLKKCYDKNEFDESYYESKNQLGVTDDIFSSGIYAYDTSRIEALEECLIDGKIDYDKLASGEEIILVAPQKVRYAAKVNTDGITNSVLCDDEIGKRDRSFGIVSEGESPYKAGDKLRFIIAVYKDYDEMEKNPENCRIINKEVTIGAIISPNDINKIKNLNYYENFGIITSLQGMNCIYPEARYASMGIDVDEKVDESIDTDIMEKLAHYADKYGGFVSSNYQSVQDQEKEYNSLYTAMLALIIIGFVICASIINNSLSARIRENKRVIGTLRAVGAAESDLVKSYVQEMISMFTWGVAIGFGGYTAAYIIIKMVTHYLDTNMELYFNPWATIAFCVLLFAVCAVNVWSKIRREMKNSIVENIREL